MKTRKIHLEQLLGKLVRDPDDAKVGRILSIHAEIEGGECVVRAYDLGAAALMENLGISLLRVAHGVFRMEPLRVPWDQLDLSDPDRPRLRCPVADLKSKKL
jgi:hypothetical protein